MKELVNAVSRLIENSDLRTTMGYNNHQKIVNDFLATKIVRRVKSYIMNI